MITKSELQAAHQAMRAGGANIEPPSAEEVLAYIEGQLPEADETRVRELLVAHPDMLRAVTMPFPPGDAAPGDDGYLSEHEVARQWKSFQGAFLRSAAAATAQPDRSLNVWRAAAAIAAALAITLGGLLWQSAENARRLTLQLTEPRVAGYQLLLPDGQRGPGGVPTLTPVGDSYLIATPILGATPFDQYRLEIVDLATSRSVWRRDGLPRPDSDTFAILIPRETFHPGMFQVVLYGVNGKVAEKLATYTVTVPRNES